jgi:mRNA interferase HigB
LQGAFDIKGFSQNVSFVANNRVVFNNKGNHQRMEVVAVFHHGVGYIWFVGTHEEYDRIDVTTT